MYLKFGAEQEPLKEFEWDYTRVLLCQLFPGWTLDYVDRLSHRQVSNLFAIIAAQHKARDKKQA